MLYGHRGVNIKSIENTLDAFYSCRHSGIESDVRLTKDNIPVLHHDDSLLRVYGVNKMIKDLTFKQLNNIINENITKLETLLYYAKYENKKLILDIKEKDYKKIKYIMNITKWFCRKLKYNMKNIIFLVWTDFNNTTEYTILKAFDEDYITNNEIINIKNLNMNGVCLEFTNTELNNNCINKIKNYNLIVNTYTKLNLYRPDIEYFTVDY